MTALEQLLKEELESEKKHSKTLEARISINQKEYEKSLNSIKSEYLKSLEVLMQEQKATLNTIASQYTMKLKELCESKEQDEALESELEKRLTALERALSLLQITFKESLEDLKNTN